jgi:beta-D-xylosidase 4
VRLDDLLDRATYDEKAGVMTSTGLAITRLGVPSLGSGEDTHGIASGCISDPAPNSTGCPTCFPAGPNTGAAFDRDLWTAIGETIGREGRALNNMHLAPLYFFDPDMNLMRDPRCA